MENPFENLIYLSSSDIEKLIIKETYNKDNCYIYNDSVIIGGFPLVNKPNVKTILNVSFYKSSTDKKYLPRLEFRKVNKENTLTKSKGSDVIINFSDGEEAKSFWKAIQFLQGFKELVDLGDFHSKY